MCIFIRISVLLFLLCDIGHTLFWWKNCFGYYGFPVITLTPIIFNATSGIGFPNTTVNPIIINIDPRFSNAVVNTRGNIELEEDIDEIEISTQPTFPTFQTNLLQFNLEDLKKSKNKKRNCGKTIPRCPNDKIFITSFDENNATGILSNGCICTDMNKIQNIFKLITTLEKPILNEDIE